METIQVSRLKQYTNDVVERVAAGQGATGFSVTVRGRDTDVVLVHRSQLRAEAEPQDAHLVTVDAARAPGLYDVADARIRREMLDAVEAGRDASGDTGERT